MIKMKALLSNNVFKNFSSGLINKNINFRFSQLLSYSNNLFKANNFNYNLNKECFGEFSIEDKNNEIESEANIEKIEFKNKSRKVAERKRKKRKTGKDIRIRWR